MEEKEEKSPSKSNNSKSPPRKRKKKKTRNRKITKNHPQFELAYDMMLGIRHTMHRVEKNPAENLDGKCYKELNKYNFPHKGSATTPKHEMRNFKFKDYCPQVFRRIRAQCGIKPADYLKCVCGEFNYLEFISNSKSGAFFFYSYDRRYMIKTISQKEAKFLVKILEHYLVHLTSNPSTLLTRFYGLHRVKPHNKKKMHFLIMGSVFDTRRIMHHTFDLKGSLQGRFATKKERSKDTCVLKDQDFLKMRQTIRIGPGRGKLLTAQLQKDSDFLHYLNIMDYSLLLGVHDQTKPGPMLQEYTQTSRRDYSVDMSRSTPIKEEPRDMLEEEPTSPLQKNFAPQPPSPSLGPPLHGYPKKYKNVISPGSVDFDAPHFPSIDQVEKKLATTPKGFFAGAPLPSAEDLRMSKMLLFSEDGGMVGEDGEGHPNGQVYYMGIIDILIEYTPTKKLESAFKSLRYKLNTISACNPKLYAHRFAKFITDAIR